MKGFLRRFKVCFILLGVLVVFWCLLVGLHGMTGRLKNGSRQNTECTTGERVFDKADVLTR